MGATSEKGRLESSWTAPAKLAYNRRMKTLSQDKAEFLLVVARRVVPEVAELDDHAIRRMTVIIDRALADRPLSVQKQFATFLGVVKWAPVLRFLAPFNKLAPATQDAVLGWFEDCPVALLRKGTWGLKSLVFMGYYGRTDVWEEIGYRPTFDSRERLHA